MRWIRLDTTWDSSEWLFVLSPESQLAWVKLLCYVKAEGSTGKAKRLSPIVAAKRWGLGSESVEKIEQAAVSHGALEASDGQWRIVKWAEYQQGDPTNAERQMRYRDRKFKRTQVFERDGYRCQECGSTDDLVVDHIIPVSQGGDTCMDNLQTLCRKCNASKKDSIVTGSNALRHNKNGNAVRATETETETSNTPLPPFGGVELPKVLDTKAFREAWAEWEKHRKEKRSKLTETTIKKQFALLAKHPKQAVEILNDSMTKGYTGLFPPKDSQKPQEDGSVWA